MRTFNKLVGEKKRTYHFAAGEKFGVLNVAEISISASGTHYLVCDDGSKFIVSPKWLLIEVDADEWSL